MKKRISFWDILAWVVLALILLWITLKICGIINTSELIEYAPYFGAIYLAGWAMHKLETASNDVKEIKRFNKDTIREINDIKSNCLRNHPK